MSVQGDIVFILLKVAKLFFFSFLGLHPWHIEVARLGIKSGLQLLAYATATAMPDLSLHVYLQPTPQLTATPDP